MPAYFLNRDGILLKKVGLALPIWRMQFHNETKVSFSIVAIFSKTVHASERVLVDKLIWMPISVTVDC